MADSITYRECINGEFGYYLVGKLIPSNPDDDYLKMIGLDRYLLYQKLTNAEIEFFEKSIYTGEFTIDPRLTEEKKVFRAIFLEWIFHVPEHEQFRFLRVKKLVFENIIFKNYFDLKTSMLDQASKENRENVLELRNNKVEVDLEFKGCVFHGGIDFSDSVFNNLSFVQSIIKAPEGKRIFSGERCHIQGSLLIKSLGPFKTIIGSEYTSDFCDTIDFPNSRIDKDLSLFDLRFVGDQQEDKNESSIISFYNSSINFININSIECHEVQLNFTLCTAKKTFIENSNFFRISGSTESIDLNGFHGDFLAIRKSKIVGFLNMIFMQIEEYLEISSSMIVAADYFSSSNALHGEYRTNTAIMSHTNCPVIKLNDKFVSLGALDLSAINCNKLWLNNALMIGYGNKTNDVGNYEYALNLEKAKISNFIGFNRLSLSLNSEATIASLENLSDEFKQERIEDFKPSKNKSPELQTDENDLIANQWKWYEDAKQGFKNLEKELKSSQYKESYSSAIIYGANFKGMQVTGQFDCRGAYFYSPIEKERGSSTFKKRIHTWIQKVKRFFSGFLRFPPDVEYDVIPALNLSHLQVSGALFLNQVNNDEVICSNKGGSNYLCFKSNGVVDLRFARLDKFFLTPHLNTIPDHVWYINGLTYNGIVTKPEKESWLYKILPFLNNPNSRRLEALNWFTPMLGVSNRRQPYEELAFFFNRMGNDSKAKKIIIQGRYKTTLVLERFFYRIVNFFAELGMPAYRSLIALMIIYISGVYFYSFANDHGGFVRAMVSEDLNKICSECVNSFSPWEYSFLNMWPVKIVDEQHFIPTDKRFTLPFEFLGKNYETKSIEFYRIVQKILSTVFLALFIIGITKITKQDHHNSN